VKSLKRFDLNLNLKGWFEKGLKKKKKKKRNLPRLPFGPAAQQPANTSLAATHAAVSFFFFLSLAVARAPPVSHYSFPFHPFPLLCFARAGAPPRRPRRIRFTRALSFLYSRVMANNHPAILSPSISRPLLGPTSRDGRRPSMASRRPLALPFPLPSLSLSPCRYLRLSPSSCLPLCSHIASTRAWASFHHRRHLGSAISTSGARIVGEEPALPSYLFLWICTGAAESSLPQVHNLGTLWCFAPVRSWSATGLLPLLILATAISSTPASSSSSSLSGEQHFTTLLCPARALQHRHPRAGEPRATPFRCRPPWTF
jgi:hypothetical protein